MKRDMQQHLKDLDGNPLKDPAGKDVILSTVCINALLNSYADEQALTGKEKADRYQVAMKIQNRPQHVDLTAEQLALVKMLVGKGYGPLVVGQAYAMLEMEPTLVEVKAPPE